MSHLVTDIQTCTGSGCGHGGPLMPGKHLWHVTSPCSAPGPLWHLTWAWAHWTPAASDSMHRAQSQHIMYLRRKIGLKRFKLKMFLFFFGSVRTLENNGNLSVRPLQSALSSPLILKALAQLLFHAFWNHTQHTYFIRRSLKYFVLLVHTYSTYAINKSAF